MNTQLIQTWGNPPLHSVWRPTATPVTMVTKSGPPSNCVRGMQSSAVSLYPVPGPFVLCRTGSSAGPSRFPLRRVPASFLHLSASPAAREPAQWESPMGRKRFSGARLPARKEAAAFSPTPPREAAAHGMGVFVCVCVGRAFRGKATESAEAAAGQGAR